MSKFASIIHKEILEKDKELRLLVEQITDSFKLTTMQIINARSLGNEIKFDRRKINLKLKTPKGETVDSSKEYIPVGSIIDSWVARKDKDTLRSIARKNGLKLVHKETWFSHLKLNALIGKNYILDNILVIREFNYFDEKLVYRIYETLPLKPAENPVASPGLKLKLQLRSIECIEPTDNEWFVDFGEDSISLGGVAVDDRQNAHAIRERDYGTFSAGRINRPGLVLREFPLDNINPSYFFANLAIAEKDNGGFAEFLEKLYEAIESEVTELFATIGAAAGGLAGAAIGGTAGSFGGPIGLIIGIIAGVILGAFIGWLVGILRDDIFEPQLTSIVVNESLPFTISETLTFENFGGTYRVGVRWVAAQ